VSARTAILRRGNESVSDRLELCAVLQEQRLEDRMVLKIVVVASLLALCGCRTCWYKGKAVPPSESHPSALSPRPLFFKQARTLTISEGQMLVSIAKAGRVSDQVMGTSRALPFKSGSFILLHLGNILIDHGIAHELYRVASKDSFALVKVCENRCKTAMRHAGWIWQGSGEFFHLYQKGGQHGTYLAGRSA